MKHTQPELQLIILEEENNESDKEEFIIRENILNNRTFPFWKKNEKNKNLN